MDGQSVVNFSAPTSFGKSLVIDALIASGRYPNIVIIVPTIALIDETRRRLSRFRGTHKISRIDQPAVEANIFILTQERHLHLHPEFIDCLRLMSFTNSMHRSLEENDRCSTAESYASCRKGTIAGLSWPVTGSMKFPILWRKFTCIFKCTAFHRGILSAQSLTAVTAYLVLCRGLEHCRASLLQVSQAG